MKRYVVYSKIQYIIISLALWIVISIIWSNGVSGQNKSIDFEKYSVEQGLSNVSAHSLLQDKQGFIWIGTQGGLSRFDGYSFVNYYSDPYDSTTLKDNYITCLAEDTKGRIWAGTRLGISRLDKTTNQVSNFAFEDGYIHKKLYDYITSILVDKSGNLRLGTKGGLLFFNAQLKIIEKIALPTSEGAADRPIRVNDLKSDQEGNIWIGTEQGLYFCTAADNKARKVDIGNVNITKLVDDGNILWMGTAAGVYRLDKKTKIKLVILPSALGQNEIYTLTVNSKNQLLAGTLEGIKVLDRSASRFMPFFTNERVVSWYQSNRPQALIEDFDHSYWIATFSDGVYHYDPSPPKFNHYKYEVDNPFSLNENAVYGLCEDKKGNVWVGTSTDLNILNKKSRKFDRFSKTPTGTIWIVYEDNEGVIWVGSRKALIEIKPDKSIEYYTSNDKNRSNPGKILSIFQDHKGIMWFGGRDGLYSHVKGSGIFTPFNLPQISPDSIQLNYITEDKNNQLWVATTYGLYLVDSDRKNVRYFLKNDKDITCLSDNNLSGILISDSGELYVSSINYGLNKFNPTTETFEYFTTKDGLPDEKLWGIVEDLHGMIWLSTSKGISRFDPKTRTFQNFDIHDGLQSYEFNNLSFHKSKHSDKIYFGGINGFNVFHPDSITYNQKLPEVAFTRFRYGTGKSALSDFFDVQGLSLKNNIVLPVGTETVSIEFSALNLKQSFKNKYKYQLEGVNLNWMDLGIKHDVSFAGLAPGDYKLLVHASNNDGKWTIEPASILFTITPSWWQTIWFKILMIILAIWMVYSVSQYNLTRSLEMENIRTQIASDLHDEVGSMLSGLAMQSELLLSGNLRDDVSRLENIALISRSVIGKMRDLVWSIDSRRDSMGALIDRMEEQAADLFHPLEIGFRLEAGEYVSRKKLSVLVRQQLFLIFSEAITNVVRHSNASHVHIKIGNFENVFELSIHDNGTNKSKMTYNTGLGKSNMKMRAEKLGANLSITQKDGYCIRLIMNRI